jgi:Tol biopolymer transport system component
MSPHRSTAIALLLLTLCAGAAYEGLLFFEARLDGGWQVCYIELPDGGPLPLTATPALDAETPAFNGDADPTPDGGRLVFTSNRSGEDELYLLQLLDNGKTANVQQLTDSPGVQAFPALYPAGDELFYHSEGAESWQIYRRRLLTGETTVLTSTGDNLFPTVDAAGRCAYCSTRDDNWELYLWDAATGEETRLTDNDAADLYPAFSPDGRELVFSSKRGDGESYDLYLLDLSDGSVEPLAADPAASLIYPAWAPGMILYHIQRGEDSRLGWLELESGATGEFTFLPGVDLGHPAPAPAGE